MTESLDYQQAIVLVERAHRLQMQGQLGDAIELYERSIDVCPTAVGHTNLGWAYSMMGHYDEAIEQCEIAITIDPNRGNAYNDIGVYLLTLGETEDAIEWFEFAVDARDYDARHFALCNLGRTYEKLGKSRTALSYYDQSLVMDARYIPALQAKYTLLGRLN